MSTKKNSKPSQKKSRAELRKQLARDLEAVLTNPEIPAHLYNGIADAITEFESECVNYNAVVYSAEAIGKSLELYAQQGGAS